jgi:3-isopropylmalate/(R)-2-methylmalate dehydratase small subunit
MEKFTELRGVAAPLMRTNIDTGTIIASAWLRSRSFDLGEKLFANWRYALDGKEKPDFVLNQTRYRASKILLAGPLFGCGSSREAAVWALVRFGIRCVIAPSFGDIFSSNCVMNGLLPARVAQSVAEALLAHLQEFPGSAIKVDLEPQRITCDERTYGFSIDSFLKTKLLNGWDDIDVTMSFTDEMREFLLRDASARPWSRPARADDGRV